MKRTKVKRILKITGISVGSLLTLLIILALAASWLIFTPSRLTPVVRKQLSKYLNCRVEIDTVDFSLFHSFPNAGLRINNLLLINPMDGAPSDTLLKVAECYVDLNLKALIKSHEIIVNEFHLNDGVANVFTDSAGRTNYMVFKSEPEPEDTVQDDGGFRIDSFDVKGLSITNVRLHYDDRRAGLDAVAHLADMEIDAEFDSDKFAGDCKIETDELRFTLNDSVPLLLSMAASKTSFKGDMKNTDLVQGLLDATFSDVTFSYDNVVWIDAAPVEVHLPLNLSVGKKSVDLQDAYLSLSQHLLKIYGNADADSVSGDINMNLSIAAEKWSIDKVLTLLPAAYRIAFDDIDVKGVVSVKGSMTGVYSDSIMPVVHADILCENAEIVARNYWAYPIKDINADVSADINLKAKSKLLINSFKAKTANNTLEGSGTVNDLLGKQNCELSFKTGLTLGELKSVLPDEMKVVGKVQGTFKTKFALANLLNATLDKIDLNGAFTATDMDLTYDDSMRVRMQRSEIELKMPGASGQTQFKEMLSAKIKTPALNFGMGSSLTAESAALDATVGMSNVTDASKTMSLSCNFAASSFNVKMDSILAQIAAPSGNFTLLPASKNPQNMAFRYSLRGDSLVASAGNDFIFHLADLNIRDGKAEYDNTASDPLLQWSPSFSAVLRRGYLSVASLPDPLRIPVANLNFTPEGLDLKKTVFRLGNSDFELSGTASNLQGYLKHQGSLTAEFDFASDYTDVYQMMDYFNGLGTDTLSPDVKAVAADSAVAAVDGDPFMVPLGLDIRLKTNIKKAKAGQTEISDIIGSLTIKDGVLVMEEMGFTSNAARMLLSAVYKSPRPNHLFAGIDFHLLDIKVAELIEIVPYVDSIVPMLKALDGKGEFHFAIETNLNSKYEIKMSTLRGAAAFEGANMTLKRSNLFNKIAEKLLYGSKESLTVDSIDVEMTIFRDEVDLYPFLLSMGKYKAVIGGRHNIDRNLTYDYHISLTDCPLPVRLGVDVFDKGKGLQVKLASCKYAALYRPKKQGAVEKQTLEFKKLILESLRKTVKE